MNKKFITFSIVFCLILGISVNLFLSKREVEYDGFAYRGDDYSYSVYGKLIARSWRTGEKMPKRYAITYRTGDLYYFYCGAIYYIFGEAGTHVLLAISSLLHVLIVIPVYFICKELKIKPTYWLFLFWPSTFYWSLFNLKDTMCLFVLFMVIHFVLQVERKKNLLNAFGLLIFLYLGNDIRVAFSVLFLIALCYLAIRWKWNKMSLPLFVVIYLLSQQYVLNPVSIPSTCSSIRANPTTYGITSYLQYSTKTWWGTVIYFPKGVFTSLFYPFLFTKLKYALMSVESIVWWCFLPFVFRGMLKRKMFLITMIFGTWLILLALTQGNMGTLLRFKSILYCLGFILCRGE